MKWTEEETLRVIALYKECQLLWDKTSPLYSSWFARNEAFDRIVEKMNKPGLTAKEVRLKIKNLRSSFYSEVRRIAKNNFIITPSKRQIWFDVLKPVITHNTSEELEGQDNDSTDEESAKLRQVNQNEEDDDDEDVEENERPGNIESYVVSISKEYLDSIADDRDNMTVEFDKPSDLSEHSELFIPIPTPQATSPSLPQTTSPSLPQTTSPSLQQTTSLSLAPLQTQSEKRSQLHIKPKPEIQVETEIQYIPRDQFYEFSRKMAQKLRRLPLDRALVLQVEILSLLAKERIRLMERSAIENKQDD